MNKPLPPGVSASELVDIHEQAAHWHTKRQQPGWDENEEQSLQQWLASHPLHQEIFNSMGQTRQLLTLLKKPAQAPEQAQKPILTPVHTTTREHRATAAHPSFFRPGLATLGSLLVLGTAVFAAGGWYWWDNTPQYQASYQTQAQSQNIELPDGTQIQLNIQSQLDVSYYPRRRETTLTQGEAFFDVTPNQQKPFTVAIDETRVKVVGTSFNIRTGPPELQIQVSSGRVEVTTSQGSGARQVGLSAGTGLALPQGSNQYRSLATDSETVGQWRKGQLRFKQTLLPEALAELSRYLPQPIKLQGAGLAQMPVSGYASLQDPESFIQLLPELVPVKVSKNAQGQWLVSGR